MGAVVDGRSACCTGGHHAACAACGCDCHARKPAVARCSGHVRLAPVLILAELADGGMGDEEAAATRHIWRAMSGPERRALVSLEDGRSGLSGDVRERGGWRGIAGPSWLQRFAA